MEDSRLIKNIWRFNAFVIAVAGILAIGVLLFGGYEIFKVVTGEKNKTEIVNIDPETKIEEKFELGSMGYIPGSKSVMVPLGSEQAFDLAYSSKRARSIRNFMFSNLRTKKSHWLLETNDYLISYHQQIREGNRNNFNNVKAVQVITYEIVKSDTNNDKRLTNSDLLTVSLSSPEGERYTEMLSNVEDVIGYQLIDDASLAIMFKRDDRAFIAYVSLIDFKITSEIELPKSKEN